MIDVQQHLGSIPTCCLPRSYYDLGLICDDPKSEFRKKDNDSTVINFYTKVIFPSNEAKEKFYKKANIPANEEYITFEQLKRYFQ